MKKSTATAKKTSSSISSPARSSRMKCSCASCQCTVDMDRALRKGNLVYCGRVCMTQCTLEQCMCEHDYCAV